jgi:hypothetical protein
MWCAYSSTLLLFLVSATVKAQDVPDDIWHCRNPKDVDKKNGIECDKNTFEWRIDKLKSDWPPQICGDNYINEQPDVLPPEWDDLLEPCLLWSIFYGTLNTDTDTPTAEPSIATDTPTKTPTLSPSDNPSSKPSFATANPTFNPTLSPTAEDGEDFRK